MQFLPFMIAVYHNADYFHGNKNWMLWGYSQSSEKLQSDFSPDAKILHILMQKVVKLT